MKKFWEFGIFVIVVLIIGLWVVGSLVNKHGLVEETPITKTYLAKTYLVKCGDTLSTISFRIYGRESRWREIWKYNPNIKDPNVIYPNQLIFLDPSMKSSDIAKVPKLETLKPSWIKPKKFRADITSLMFKEIGLPEQSEIKCFYDLQRSTLLLNQYNKKNYFQYARTTTQSFHDIYLGLEIHKLASVLTDVYVRDPDLACLLVALAWTETGFHNRRGSSGELGFYQILPSTIKDIYKEKASAAMFNMEADPKFSTDFVIWYLGLLREKCTLGFALYKYNGHPSYPGIVTRRYNTIRRMMIWQS